MGRVIALLYGLVAYVAFAATIVYSIGFVSGLGVPKTIDSGPAGPPMQAIVINLLLMALFAVQQQCHGATPVQEMVDTYRAGVS